MKTYLYFIITMISICSLNADDHKPTLDMFVYENSTEENSAEVILIVDSKHQEPSLLPFAHPLSVTEMFVQSAQNHGTNLSNFFTETDQPRDIKEHIRQLNKAVKLRFIVPQDKSASLIELLECIALMPEQAGKISRTVHEKTKADLTASLPYFTKSDFDHNSAEELAQLFELTPMDLLNTWMSDHFYQSKNALIVALPKNSAIDGEAIAAAVKNLSHQWEVVEHDKPIANTELESIGAADKGIVVDGKIYMDSPSWWQKQSTGYLAGGALIFISLLMMIPTYGLSLALLGISGVFLINHSYLNDPKVIEKLRTEIYQNGFHYAHEKDCIGATLTPHERRHFFVAEICDRQYEGVRYLKDFAGYYALNSYDYNSSELSSFLFPEERKQLIAIQRNYFANLGNVTDQKAQIEADLAQALIPFKDLRDASVKTAYAEYDNCTAVVLYTNLLAEYEKSKEYVNHCWQIKEIDSERRDAWLKEIEEDYTNKKAPLTQLVNQAKVYLKQRLAEIEAQYAVHVALCKNTINYAARMDALENIKWEVTGFYSKELSKYVIEYMRPVEDNLADFLDLRTK